MIVMDNKNLNTQIAKTLGVDLKTVSDMNAAFAESLKDFALQLDSVSIPGFGSFIATKTPEKIITGNDGKRRLLPPSITLSFRTSVVMRKRLSE